MLHHLLFVQESFGDCTSEVDAHYFKFNGVLSGTTVVNFCKTCMILEACQSPLMKRFARKLSGTPPSFSNLPHGGFLTLDLTYSIPRLSGALHPQHCVHLPRQLVSLLNFLFSRLLPWWPGGWFKSKAKLSHFLQAKYPHLSLSQIRSPHQPPPSSSSGVAGMTNFIIALDKGFFPPCFIPSTRWGHWFQNLKGSEIKQRQSTQQAPCSACLLRSSFQLLVLKNKMETIKWTCGRSNWSQLVICCNWLWMVMVALVAILGLTIFTRH